MGELKGWRDKSESSLRVRFTMSWREVIAERALSEATRIGGCSLRLLVWHWGSEQFREYLLKKVDAAAIRRNRNYQSAQMGRDHGQAEAEKIVQQGLERFGLSESDLKSLPGSDPRKVAIAGSIHQSTTTPQGWTAERLQMKSAANVSQQLSRAKKAAKPKIKPGKPAVQSGFVDCPLSAPLKTSALLSSFRLD